MDGSTEVHCAQGDKQRREDTHPKVPSSSPGEELTGEGSAGSLRPTNAPFCQSGRERG